MIDTAINTNMTGQDRLMVDNAVNTFNKSLGNTRVQSRELGKDDFLKLLITQLSNQDPTSPMENNEFIAQMAQFSSLEQMTNMNAEFTKMATAMKTNEAQSLIGRQVELDLGDASEKGMVQAATREESPRVLVNGRYYTMEQVASIYAD